MAGPITADLDPPNVGPGIQLLKRYGPLGKEIHVNELKYGQICCKYMGNLPSIANGSTTEILTDSTKLQPSCALQLATSSKTQCNVHTCRERESKN